MPTLLKIRPDFKLHIFDKNKIVLYSDSKSFLLSHTVFVKILIILNEGPRSILDLNNLLASMFSEKLIDQALRSMIDTGLLVEHYEATFSPSMQAFWYENGLDAQILESTLKNRKISVKNFCKNSNDELISKFTHFFEDLGFSFSENSECIIFIVDNYLNPDLDNYLTNNLTDEQLWIPLKYVGTKIWVGPLLDRSKAHCCWECLKQSLKTNLRVEVDLFGNDFSHLRVSNNVNLPGNEDLAFKICAIQLARWFVDPQSCSLSNHLLTFDPFNFQAESHLCGLILCKTCSVSRITNPNIGYYELKKCPIIFKDENGPRSATNETTFDRLKTIISPITGIVPTYVLFQVNRDYVASSVRNLPHYDFDPPQKRKSLRIPDVVVGKGRTELQAKIGCFAESIERYNSTFCSQSCILSKYHDLPHKGLAPEELLLFSDTQYENRNVINNFFGSFNQISKKYDNSKIRWSQIRSLNDKNSVFVPTSYCYLNYPYENEIEFCPGDSNGCASGNTVEEAIVYAILELIERDAVAIWWYNKIQYPRINTKSLKDPLLIDLIDVHLRKKRIFHLIDITSDLSIPTFVAISADHNGDQIHFGTACHFNPTVAMIKAIHELNQIMTHTTSNQTFSSENVHSSQKEFAKWITNENLKDHSFLNPQSKIDINPKRHVFINSHDFLDCIYELTKILNSKNLNTYWLNLTQVNVSFFTVKVIIPGLRHFWNRLGPGRLYNVPVELGLIPSQLAENQMNKIPYFL